MQSIQDIQRIRRKYDLTQKELAGRAGVSQSLIAKIEAGKLDPTFSKAQKIFEALEELREKEEVKAKDIMHKKVCFVNADDSVKEVIKIMKTKGISQIPVLSKEKIIGIITEATLLNKLLENPQKVVSYTAGDVLEETPPIIPPRTGIKTVSELLRDNPIVLVAEKGDVLGIIAKTDLLEKIE